MLLQSHGGVIRLFPAVPEAWKEISFRTLRAEGAFLVSADRAEGRVKEVTIVPEAGGPCRLISPFSGKLLVLATTPGQAITLTADP